MLTLLKSVYAQPRIGAEIWIEPGQTSDQIDRWFQILQEQKMPVARLFIMWNYVEKTKGVWDFTLYDAAFKAANKYDISIEATFTANHGPVFHDKGFWYREQNGSIPSTVSQLNASQAYIKNVVERYRSDKALGNWWLMNEPGQLNKPDELAMNNYKKWLIKKYKTIQDVNNAWLSNFSSFDSIEYDNSWDKSGGFNRPTAYLDWNWFWRDHLTWYMEWMAVEIRKYDTTHLLHVNPHGIFDILPKYDLPHWQTFLSSLGASIHPSWHLSLFNRNDYAIGVGAICDIIKGAIEPKPFWMSELQGGNNIWSGGMPLCPTDNDIKQWLWTGIGTGADQAIFWCLNWRKQGGEAGEWSLLDFNNMPSERIIAANEVATIIENNKSLFSIAKPAKPVVTILLSPESMLILQRKDDWKDIAGRGAQAHIKASLAYYKMLTEMGIPVAFKQMDDFDWLKQKNHLAIIANAVAIRQDLVSNMQAYVAAGNELFVTGLTGYFDEHENNVFQTNFALKTLFGGEISEVKLIDPKFNLSIGNIMLPTHYWMSEIKPLTGKAIATEKGKIIAVENNFGKGRVVWIPANVDLGAWLYDELPMASYISTLYATLFNSVNFRITELKPHVLMRIMNAGAQNLMIITNGSDLSVNVPFNNLQNQKPMILSANGMVLENNQVNLKARETAVILWK